MVISIDKNESPLLCIRPLHKSQDELIVSKATFDAKIFFDIPADKQEMVNHKKNTVSIKYSLFFN